MKKKSSCYNEENANYILIENEDFLISHILECGQCFRFEKLGEDDYIIIAHNRVLRIYQDEEGIRFYCTQEEYDTIWKHYFDLDRDYAHIKTILSKKDETLSRVTKDKYGIRILKQEPLETLISFIISQNKQIPHIKKIIEAISMTYGNEIMEMNNKKYYSFPSIDVLMTISEQELRDLKVGFRAPYILDAIDKAYNKDVDLSAIYDMNYEEAKNVLMTIKGVGTKVADCVLLYGYGKHEVFPTDVWVKRVMEYYYFEEETAIKKIHLFAKDYFGDMAGFAQQYLFYYARDNNIGKNNK